MKDKCTCTASLSVAMLAIGAGMLIVSSANAQTDRGREPVDVLGTKGSAAALQRAMIAQKNTNTRVMVDGKRAVRSRPSRPAGKDANGGGIAGPCPNPAHDCCTTGTAGCSDAACCNTVCAADPFCCNTSWDGICVGEANSMCGVDYCGGGGGPCPNPDHDCFTTGTPGCSDEACCNTVCAADPFCCDTAWDSICVGEAFSMCGGTGPANDLCVDRIDVVADTLYTYSNLGAGTDGIAHPACLAFGDDNVGSDIWYNFTATATDLHSISLCGSGYDTKVAVYAGCDVCPPSDAQLLVCNDDSCGLQSEATWNGVAGECYKIRVGGYAGSQGSGQFIISQGKPPSACDSATHPCDVTGGPGCTDPICCCIVCAADAFCCDVAWDGICVSEAAALCGGGGPSSCDTTCPPGGIDEGEPCGGDINGGCNALGGCSGTSGNCCIPSGGLGCEDPTCSAAICAADPFCCDVAWDGICAASACADDVNCDCSPAGGDPYGEIACGETVCGHAFAENNFRDTDWYRFSVSGDATIVKFDVNANFPVALFILNDACPPAVLIVGSGACPTTALAALPAGNYVVFVAVNGFNGVPCEGTDCFGNPTDTKYTLKMSCIACSDCQGDTDGNGVVNVDDLLNVINAWGKCD